jgi:hypothetical protein
MPYVYANVKVNYGQSPAPAFFEQTAIKRVMDAATQLRTIADSEVLSLVAKTPYSP